jgi:hypothetical protein
MLELEAEEVVVTEDAPEMVEAVQVHLHASDDPETRAIKSWAILGGNGPVNPTFMKIFEAYAELDKQAFFAAVAPDPLMG